MSVLHDCLSRTKAQSDPNTFLSVYPHSTTPGHNLYSNISSEISFGDAVYNASVLYKPFMYNASFPIPVYPPAKVTRSVLNGLDPCLTLIKQKKAWERNKDVLLNSCDKSMVPNLNKSSETRKVDVHPNIAMLAEHLERDPDQHFTGSYNWYFSGSNIETITYGDNKYLLRPNGTSGELLLSPLILQNNQWTPETFELPEIPVELKSFKTPCQIDVINNLALVREKTNCGYLRIKETKKNKTKVKELFKVSSKSDIPFICASINKENLEEFCTLCPNEELTVWNASLNSPVSTMNFNLEKGYSSDSWGFVYYTGRNTVLYVNRYAVHMLDLRANNNSKDVKMWPVNKLVEICEEISCCHSGSRHSHYIGTNHHLLSLDMRQGWTERWTHGISSPPSLIKVLQRNDQDLIVVASQRTDNVVFIQNSFENEDSGISRMHPYTLPSLRESLHTARYNGLCLDHLLKTRFTMSLTGLCCLEDKYINVIRCTSIGDIFWQKLLKSNDNQSSQSPHLSQSDLNKYEEFEIKCEETYISAPHVCTATSMKNTEELLEFIYTSSCPDDESIVDPSVIMKEKLPLCKQLKTYCDMLAPVLLEPWNINDLIDDGEESNASIGTVVSADADSSSEEENDIEQAVSNWLNTYSKEMTTITEYPIDDEDLQLSREYSKIIDSVLGDVESTNQQVSPTKLDDNSEENQNLETNVFNILADSPTKELRTVEKYQNLGSKRVTKQKPVPISKKKYVSGF